MAKSTPKLREAERDQRRARDRERLKLADEQPLSSEGVGALGPGAFPKRTVQVFARYLKSGRRGSCVTGVRRC